MKLFLKTTALVLLSHQPCVDASIIRWGKTLLAWNIENCKNTWQLFTVEQSTKEEEKNVPTTTFADLGGAISPELLEVPALINDTERYAAIGASVPKGILLYGPAGTGKTSIARAIAGETGAAFFTASGSEFIHMYVGVGPARIRELFNKARAAIESGVAQRALIFIDEIDAIGGKREQEPNSEYRNTLNELLNQMDGFHQDPHIMVIAATNNIHMIDAALLRPGRFDRLIKIDLPDETARLDILKLYLSKTIHSVMQETLEKTAHQTQGFSPAELKNIINEAAIITVRDQRDMITSQDLVNATQKAVSQKKNLR